MVHLILSNVANKTQFMFLSLSLREFKVKTPTKYLLFKKKFHNTFAARLVKMKIQRTLSIDKRSNKNTFTS